MAFSSRYLIAAFFLGLLSVVIAQPAAEPAPPAFRVLSLGSIEPLYYSLDGRSQRRVSLSTTSYSRPHPVPENGLVTLFRLGPPATPGGPPTRVIAGEIRISHRQPGDTTAVILLPGGLPGKPPPTLSDGTRAEFASVILDDTPSAHPVDTIRVLSFSKQPAAVRLGQAGAQIQPYEAKIVPYPDGDRAMLQIATHANNTWMPIVSNLQMLAPGTRLTLLLCDIPPSPDNPAPTEIVYRRIAEVLPLAAR